MARVLPTLLVLLLIASVLSGCLGGSEEPVEPAQAPEDPRPEAANTTTEASEDPGPAGTEEPPEPVLVEHPFTWDGSTGTFLLGCAGMAGVGACVPPLAVQSGDRIHNRSVEGDLQHVEFTVTWEPASPAMEELQVQVRGDCEQDCTSEAKGASPLTLVLDTSDDGSPWFHIVVSPVAHTTSVAWVWTGHDQPFHVEGVYTALEEGAL